jgi:lysophospholipase L1-like esterase
VGKPPSRRGKAARPICFYGTSVTQGGCASRPGMVYTSILGRWLDRPTINLGFSGNGQAEPEMARLLAELDPAVYVLDCMANMDPKLTTERMDYMVRTLRAKHPQTPIVVVECLRFQNEDDVEQNRTAMAMRTAAMKIAYDRLSAGGIGGLHYLKADDLLGHDGEGTVDGIHATDLGFQRMADVFTPVLSALM